MEESACMQPSSTSSTAAAAASANNDTSALAPSHQRTRSRRSHTASTQSAATPVIASGYAAAVADNASHSALSAPSSSTLSRAGKRQASSSAAQPNSKSAKATSTQSPANVAPSTSRRASLRQASTSRDRISEPTSVDTETGPRRSARHSAVSDISSAPSQREASPFSTPATPATSYSIATNDSAASSVAGKARQRDNEEESRVSPRRSRRSASGATLPTAEAGPSSKRTRSVSASEGANGKRQKAEAAPSRKSYHLRSQSGMAPKKQQSGSGPSTSASRSKGQSRRGKGQREPGDSSRSLASPSACSDEAALPTGGAADAHGDSRLAAESREDVEQAEGAAVGDDALEHDDDDDEEGEGDDDADSYDHEDEEAYDDEEGEAGGGFGSHLRAMAGYMSGLSGRFRTLLSSLRNRQDATQQMIALQELSEVLSISNEDTLAGYFPTESFVGELVYLMGGPKPKPPKAIGDAPKAEDDDVDDDDEVAFLTGIVDNTEMMLLACRCLANLIEAMPYAAHSVVANGAVPVLNAKLLEIEFIDLAEQVLQTLEKISRESPSAIVNNGGLSAMLQYLDFFNIHVQRTALNAAANCCRRLSVEAFDKIKEVMGTIQNVLSYSDQRLVESACRCIVRIIDSYRHHIDLLKQLLTDDVVGAVNRILLPATQAKDGSSPSKTNVSPSVYAEVLKSLCTAARASPILAVTLLENNIVETLYHLLTGSPAPAEGGAAAIGAGGENQSAVDDNAGAALAVIQEDGSEAVGMADVAILQNLSSRPKEQVQEALSLVAELLPPLPRNGVFDPRRYSERALAKRRAKGAKQESTAAKVNDAEEGQKAQPPGEKANADTAAPPPPSKPERVKTEREIAREQAQSKRVETLQHKQDLVKRFTQLVLPTLVEVYAASVAAHVRNKALYGILKIVSFVDAESLNACLDNVPLASFVAGILSSRDHPILVQGALQLVELLTTKLSDVYSGLLRREGVMWEIEDIASKEPIGAAPSPSSSEDPSKQAAPMPAPPSGERVSLMELAGRGPNNEGSSIRPSGATLLQSAGDGVTVISSLHRAAAASSASANSVLSFTGHAMSVKEAEDSNIWRARVLCEKFAPSASNASAEGAHEACLALSEIKQLVSTLNEEETLNEEKASATLGKIAELFSKPESPISSFELLRSGLVTGLHTFAVQDSSHLPNSTRRKLLTEALMEHKAQSAKVSAIDALVRRLQETLSRLENVEITTALSGSDESSSSRRSAAANVTRQVRLKLMADEGSGSDIPRSCTNIVVSIHAITSFQALHDYLRPKIASAQTFANSSFSSSAPGSSSNLSGMLAAFASTAGLDIPESLRQRWAAASQQDKPGESSRAQPSGNEENAASSSSAAPSSKKETDKPARRRSSRLSAKAGESSKESAGGAAAETSPGKAESKQAESAAEASTEQASGSAVNKSDAKDESGTDEALARQLMEGLLQGEMEGLDEEGSYSDEYEEEFIDDQELAAMEGGNASGDQTIQLDINKDETVKSSDSAAESSAAPALSKSLPTSNASPKPPATPTGSGSYASALQKKPVDWHLAFEMDGKPIDLDTTIYRAIHRHEMETHPPVNGQPHPATRYVWTNTYTIKYRKVPGPAPPSEKPRSRAASNVKLNKATDLPASLAEHESWANILQLLRVLYELNREWREALQWSTTPIASALSEAAFVNNKLTAKLNRQLEEPMIVASNCLPQWALDMPTAFPFLFPFETRFNFLQSMSFGYNRLINRWQMQQSRQQDGSASSSRHDDSLSYLGRLTRQKVRIARSNILASAFKVFELYGGNSSLLEVEYFDEVGTGLGPTLEFYAMVSKEFAKKSLNLWRSDEAREGDEFVYAPNGLFPAPMPQNSPNSSSSKARLRAFKTLGQFVAKALYDSRIVDLNFSTAFMRAVFEGGLPATMPILRSVDNALAQSLLSLKAMPSDELAGLSLDFTLPGQSGYELHAGGSNESVDASNVDRYINDVMEHTLTTGIAAQVAAFREGFDLIFPTAAMSPFTPHEVALLFGNQEEDWSEPTLLGAIKPDHGYNGDSVPFRDVIALMSQFSLMERRDFLQWLTGSPKLPIGGFQGLHPQLTIVKRPPDNNVSADQTLPSVMTCVNFCKMPPFSSRAVMKERLLLAMREGQASFHLS